MSGSTHCTKCHSIYISRPNEVLLGVPQGFSYFRSMASQIGKFGTTLFHHGETMLYDGKTLIHHGKTLLYDGKTLLYHGERGCFVRYC